mmetsp:Transcript_12808/g.16827  ORF Transcript_12808/g.16827 Transcript_12808/m.16827 type:complete len:676 (-) Transcript_12808:421-2448(-)
MQEPVKSAREFNMISQSKGLLFFFSLFLLSISSASANKAELNIAGWRHCPEYERACGIANTLEVLYGDRISVSKVEFQDEASFKEWLPQHTPTLGPPARAHSTSPLLWAGTGEYVGSYANLIEFVKTRLLVGPKAFIESVSHPFPQQIGNEYDLVVIGGGSGGLSCAKEAAKCGAVVACLDYVKPSPQGSSWGLGGTCVNVGCIPKKLMHQAALLGYAIKDAPSFGWDLGGEQSEESSGSGITADLQMKDLLQEAGLGNLRSGPKTTTGMSPLPLSQGKHVWSKMVKNVQSHIHRLNFRSKADLKDKDVTYLNALGRFVGPNELELTFANGSTSSITADRFVVAVGGRPNQLSCPGGELAITSDDLFSLKEHPGKTLVVGASYVALECAGFLHGIGADATVMVRSILLRGFDREMSERIGSYMEKEGTRFIHEAVPDSIQKLENGRLKVTWFTKEGLIKEEEFDTVLAATGRFADTENLGLENAGVPTLKNGKIQCKNEETNIPHIYALGDVIDGVPELTPSAIQAGKLLARRLFKGSGEAMDYGNVCTTVFTPLEYGCCGLTEEEAIERLGEDNIEVYHGAFHPLEWTTVVHREENQCFTKVICNKMDNERVVGFHFLGPNAGEVTQGFGVAIKLGMTFKDIQETVGIHPTTAEVITTLSITKRSGESASNASC